MTLYCDPNVKFGGIALGGIRISHLSHIDNILNMMLTATRGRKSQVVVKPLIIEEIDLVQIANECGYTADDVCGTFSPPLESLDDIQDKAACAEFLRNNKK